MNEQLKKWIEALNILVPGTHWEITNNDNPNYESFVWYETREEFVKPTEQQILDKIVEIENLEYQKLRAKEYPPIADYLDGIVKGDTEQVQNYIDACLAIKAKYPKPE